MHDGPATSTRAEQTRARIRTAAQRLFLQHGFQATSTDAIMAAAGIASKETLYRYYPRKEELFVDVLRALTLERPYLRQLMQPAPAPTSASELRARLRDVAQDILDNMLQPEYLALMRTTLAETARFPQIGDLFRQTVPEPALRYLHTLLRQGQETGVVHSGVDLDTAGRMFLGTLLTYAIFDGLLLAPDAPRAPDTRAVDSVVATFMQAVSTESQTDE
jgi:AcrR family transcriptional regulator